ncbi:MAG: glycosyltransferase [bacterium]
MKGVRMAKTQLIQLGKYYYPVHGGMETHLYDLCSQFKERYDIQVFVANTRPTTVSETVDGVPVKRLANWGECFSSPVCPTFPLHLRRLAPNGPAIVQLHLPNPMAHLAYLWARPKGRLILMWHSDIVRQKVLSKFYRKAIFDLLEQADCVVTTSPDYIRHSPFLSKFREKCVVVPLGIAVSKFQATPAVQARARKISETYGAPMVLFVGRFTYYKGLQVLLEAAKEIDGTILLVGDGPLKKTLIEKIQGEGLHKKVRVLTNVCNGELAAYYHACEVFVLPSTERSEAFGLVQLEAMACGKPVVSTDLKTGVPWVNQHGKTGRVIPVNQPQKLALAVNGLLADADERRRLGQNGRRRVLDTFAIEKVTQKMAQVYLQVLNGGVKTEDLESLNYEYSA